MPVVTVNERIQAPLQDVWARVCDIEAYPEFMDSVIATSVSSRVERADGIIEAIAEWEVLLKGSVLKWSEREWRDSANFRLSFEQVSGDLERFEGFWQVAAVDEEVTDATLQVDFEIGIEMLRPMLDPVAVRALERNSSDMLLSLGTRVG